MTLLSRAQIDGADDLKPVELDVPEWGGSVLVRGLTGTERDNYEQSLSIRYVHPAGPLKGTVEMRPNAENASARLAVLGLIDADGKPLYRPEEAVTLAEKSAGALTRVFRRIAELSGMTDDAVKDAEGNSETDQSSGSGSTLPSDSEEPSPS